MTDSECITFLTWSLTKMRMRWPGFRKVRRQVCKRIYKRLQQLGLGNLEAYRSFLYEHPAEWPLLDGLCRVSISRFYRDASVFQSLEREVFPELALSVLSRGDATLSCWSIGCASGEEPYTLSLLWDFVIAGRFPSLLFRITATDADPAIIERAKTGCYAVSSVNELPRDWLSAGFQKTGNRFCIRESEKARVEFQVQDVRRREPAGSFDIIFCRNLVFTYFDEELQREVLRRLMPKLNPGAIFAVGSHEKLPSGFSGLTAWPGMTGIYRKNRQCSPYPE